MPNTTTQYPVSPLVTDAYPVLTLYSPAVVHAGENVTLKGVTILSPGQALLVEVISASFGPAPKTENTTFFGATGIVHVVKGTRDSENTWEYTFGTEGFAPDTYLVTVTGMTVNVTASSQFVIPG